MCIDVPSIAPRRTGGLPPDVIPLDRIVPGLPLPVAIVTRGSAVVRVVDDQRRTATYDLRGWGLEIKLPTTLTVDVRARIEATLQVLVRASASLGARLQLGPLQLALRIDLSLFAKMIVQVAAELRARLSLTLRPNAPELRSCQRVAVDAGGRAFSPASLGGPAALVVPGPGFGPAVLRLTSPGARLSVNPIAVPADKSTVRTLLVLMGTMTPRGGSREAEFEAEFETEYFAGGASPFEALDEHWEFEQSWSETEHLSDALAALAEWEDETVP